MTHVRYTVRRWCQKKIGTAEQRIYEPWFFIGNHPEEPNVVLNGQQIRTAIVPEDDNSDPPAWAIEVIHHDSTINARRWSAEIMLKRESPSHVRFSTVISHWMIPNFIGNYPETPVSSVPNFVAWLLKDDKLTCMRGNTVVSNQFQQVTHDNALDIYEQLKYESRQQPFVFVAAKPDNNQLAVDPVQLYRYLLGNANVYAFFEQSVLEEMNYYLGNAFRCEHGAVRCYLPYFDKSRKDNARIHRYFSANDISESGQANVINCIANGLAKNGSVFHPRDLTSFNDLFVLRRKLRLDRVIKEAKSRTDSEQASEELQLFMDECESIEAANQELSTQLDQVRAENNQLKSDLGAKNYQIAEAEQLRSQFQDFKQLEQAVNALNRLPESLPDVLSLAGEIFPQRLVFAQMAFKSAGDYVGKYNFWAKPEGLSIAWEMLFDLARKGYDLLVSPSSGDLEQAFGDQSRFDLAMTEGKQTKGDKKLMDQRVLVYDGSEYRMTPHLKFGNKPPKLLRIYFAIDRENERLIVGHFGEHLDNASTRKRS